MRTLTLESDPLAVTVEFLADAFRVVLDDGRELSVPCIGRSWTRISPWPACWPGGATRRDAHPRQPERSDAAEGLRERIATPEMTRCATL